MNEDYYIARPAFGFWILCDGLGGHEMGALASRVCAETIARELIQGTDPEQAIQQAHQAVGRLGKGTGDFSVRPGSTVAVLQIKKRSWTVAWAGDTRVWLFENRRLRQVTRDHTVVRKLIDWGVITPEDAKHHPDRHKVTTAVGIVNESLTIGLKTGKWNPEQVFLLGTDGMAYRDDPEVLWSILSNTVNPDQIVEELSHASFRTGENDNFTIAAVGRSVSRRIMKKAVENSRARWGRYLRTEGMLQPVGS